MIKIRGTTQIPTSVDKVILQPLCSKHICLASTQLVHFINLGSGLCNAIGLPVDMDEGIRVDISDKMVNEGPLWVLLVGAFRWYRGYS